MKDIKSLAEHLKDCLPGFDVTLDKLHTEPSYRMTFYFSRNIKYLTERDSLSSFQEIYNEFENKLLETPLINNQIRGLEEIIASKNEYISALEKHVKELTQFKTYYDFEKNMRHNNNEEE